MQNSHISALSVGAFRDTRSFSREATWQRGGVPLYKWNARKFYKRDASLGARVKTCRQLRGWSQTDLAVRSGVNVRNIRQYEQNPESICRAETRTVKSLALTLGCRMDDLLPSQVDATE